MVALALALCATPATAEETKEPSREDGLSGRFEGGVGRDDWFFDAIAPAKRGEGALGDWANREQLYEGAFDDGDRANDWFFDSYLAPSDEETER